MSDHANLLLVVLAVGLVGFGVGGCSSNAGGSHAGSQSEQTGRSHAAIANGYATATEDWFPSLPSTYCHDMDDNLVGCVQLAQSTGGCSATMVTNNWVMTADHCAPKKRYSTGFGPISGPGTWDLDGNRATRGFYVPAAYSASDLVAVANDKEQTYYDLSTHTWHYKTLGTLDYFSDGKVEGTDHALHTVTFPSGLSAADLKGVAFSPTGYVYAWFDNGYRYAGSTQHDGTDLSLNALPYTPAAGESISDIAGIAIDTPASNVYTYYSHADWTMTRSIGHSTDLDAVAGSSTVTQAPDRLGLMVGIAFDIEDTSTAKSYAYFYDPGGANTYTDSAGNHVTGNYTIASDPSRLDLMTVDNNPLFWTPDNFPDADPSLSNEVAETEGAANIVGVAIEKVAGHVFVWYDDGWVSSGTRDQLDVYRDRYAYDIGGRDYNGLLGFGISANNTVYAWWAADPKSQVATSGTRLWGWSGGITNNDTFNLTSGHHIGDIVGLAIGANDVTHVWFKPLAPGQSAEWYYGSTNNPDATYGGTWTAAVDYGPGSITDIALSPYNEAVVYYTNPARGVKMNGVTKYSDNVLLSHPRGAALLRLPMNDPMPVNGNSNGWAYGFYPDNQNLQTLYPDIVASGQTVRAYGYGTAQGSLGSLTYGDFTPIAGPGFEITLPKNAAGQYIYHGDSGGPTLLNWNDSSYPGFVGVHEDTAGDDLKATYIADWATIAGVARPSNPDLTFACFGVQCFSWPRPTPAGQYAWKDWSPCSSNWLYDAHWNVTSGDDVWIAGAYRTGTNHATGSWNGSMYLSASTTVGGGYVVLTAQCQ